MQEHFRLVTNEITEQDVRPRKQSWNPKIHPIEKEMCVYTYCLNTVYVCLSHFYSIKIKTVAGSHTKKHFFQGDLYHCKLQVWCRSSRRLHLLRNHV